MGTGTSRKSQPDACEFAKHYQTHLQAIQRNEDARNIHKVNKPKADRSWRGALIVSQAACLESYRLRSDWPALNKALEALVFGSLFRRSSSALKFGYRFDLLKCSERRAMKFAK